MYEPLIKTKSPKRTGRPKSVAVKSHWISFRVTPEEHFQILDKAARSSMSAGDYARSRTMRGIARARKLAAEQPGPFGDDTRNLFHELRKQGVLLNQIAKHCNTYQLPPPPEMLALADTINALWRRLMP